MLARNAWTVIVATTLAAAAASAQQPAKPTSTPARSSTTAPQTPAAAKSNAKTSTAAALAVNTDSAKKIVLANAPGATITSTHLRRASSKSYYSVNYKEKGGRKTLHATVDANTGQFTAAPVTTSASKPAAKKPS